jgi:hypothetical protein
MSVVVAMAFFSLGVPVGWVLHALAHRRPHPQLVAAPKNENTYGHPWPPVTELRKRLCKPPSGHSWEIKVTTTEAGHHLMTLTLVNVASGTNVDAKSVDLTWYRPHNTTWARYWESYRILGKDEFNREITGPLADWALMLTDTMTTAGQATDYVIGEQT